MKERNSRRKPADWLASMSDQSGATTPCARITLTCRPLDAVAHRGGRVRAAGELHRPRIGPLLPPCTPNRAGLVSARAESVGVHANLGIAHRDTCMCTLARQRARSGRLYVSGIHTRAAPALCAISPDECTFSLDSSRETAVRRGTRCNALGACASRLSPVLATLSGELFRGASIVLGDKKKFLE